MKNKEFIVYEGKAFTVEWYYDANGKSQSLDYYEALDTRQRAKFISLVRLMGDVGKIFNKQKFNNEGDKIFAFKPQPDRFLCFFFEGAKIIITNAFLKKQDKLPVNEKERALRHMRDFIERVKKEATTMTRKKSTFEREMKSSAFRHAFEEEYSELLLSELVCAAMEEDEISVRKLAKAVNLSPSVIQKIRKGAQKDVKIGNFLNIMQQCGFSVILEKDDQRIQLHP